MFQRLPDPEYTQALPDLILLARLSILLLCSVLISACLPFGAPAPYPTDTPTPTGTPTATPTATFVWFPSTATPSPFPTPILTPSPDLSAIRGEVIFQDIFTTGSEWQLAHTDAGSAAIGKNELTIAISQPRIYVSTLREKPELQDFYLEISASPMLCRGSDEYGILFRASSAADFYRFSLSCDGRVRVDRVVKGAASSPHPWSENPLVPSGAPSVSRLAVWAVGKEMRFYIDDQYQFTVHDPMLPGGKIGVFARSSSQQAVTVNFSDLIVYEATAP